MAYRNNVQRLCAMRGIENPIKEDDVHISDLIFRYPRHLQTEPERIEATDMNRAGRLFIQHLDDIQNGGEWYDICRVGLDQKEHFSVVNLDEMTLNYAELHFAELWSDSARRPLIQALQSCEKVFIVYKI